MTGYYSEELANHVEQRVAKKLQLIVAYRRTPMFARAEWRRAVCEALVSGVAFSERATRKPAVRWDGRMTTLSIKRGK